MRHSTIRSALIVALLAATGCSMLPTMEGSEIQARRRSAPRSVDFQQENARQAGPQHTNTQTTGTRTGDNVNSLSVNQINKITYFMGNGKQASGYLGIGTSVAQINAMLNISITDSYDVKFRQVNKVNILHDDDEHPEGGNREIMEVYLLFGDAVTQVNLLQDITINNASNIRYDQVNQVSLVDSSGRGRDGYLVFPQAGLTDQINVIDNLTLDNSQDVSVEQINSIFIVDADDFEHLYRPTEKESYLQRQYQSRMRYEQANGKSRRR